MISQTCPRCGGEGQVITRPCKKCKGRRIVPSQQELEVHIPAGVDTGVRLRLSDEGEAHETSGLRGDLYVQIVVEEDETFERDGLDLYTRVYVPYPLAVMGGEVEVPLIESTKTIKVPSHMKTPYLKVLKAEGVKDLHRNRRGNLLVEFHIETPEDLDLESKELIKKLSKTLKPSKVKKPASKKRSGFFRNFN